jgi:hypothetical protein
VAKEEIGMSPRLRTYAEACHMAEAERERLRAADLAAGKEPGSFYLMSWIPFDPATLPPRRSPESRRAEVSRSPQTKRAAEWPKEE